MATDEAVRLPVLGENGVRSIQLPDGWLTGVEVNARRVGDSIVLEPVAPPAHPSWPADYVAWLRDPSNAFDGGDPDELRRAFEDPTPP